MPSRLSEASKGRGGRVTFSSVLATEQRRWARDNLPAGFADFYNEFKHKLITRRFMEAAGVPTSQLYAGPVNLSEAMAAAGEKPACFVKPECGKAGVAAIGLVNMGNKYLSTISGEERPLEDWSRHLRAERRRLPSQYKVLNKWLVEELLADPNSEASPPDEYKFYMFAGQVQLIIVRVHGRGVRSCEKGADG